MAEKKQLKHGILIAIEGIDGAGKTTQARILSERLKNSGYSAVLLHEPTHSQWGEKIRYLAKNGRNKTSPELESELFYYDRIEDVKENINPKLKEKNVVIMDRYYFSNIAYQGARGLSADIIEKKNEEIAPKPDLVIILDISPTESSKRICSTRKDGPNHFENKEYLKEVRRLFLSRFKDRKNVIVLDGDGNHSQSEVSDSLWSLIEQIVHEAEET